jgi:hypothetical protein
MEPRTMTPFTTALKDAEREVAKAAAGICGRLRPSWR